MTAVLRAPAQPVTGERGTIDLASSHGEGIAAPGLEIFPARHEAMRTVCVLGAARGGTSMVAGIVRRLGIFMGDDLDEANNEDRAFLAHKGNRDLFRRGQEPVEERDQYLKQLRVLIASRNAAFPVWGWKDPLASFYLRSILDAIRNPVFILVTRDPGAIAQRERIEENMTIRKRTLLYLHGALRTYMDAIQIVGGSTRPTLLLSYERTLRAPEAAGEAIARIVGLVPPPGFGAWCADYVRPDRRDGSIDALGDAARRSGSVGASTPAQILITQSARIQSDDMQIDIPPGPDDPDASADRCYEAATRALIEHRHEIGERYALRILTVFTDRWPELRDGPLGVLAQELLGGQAPPIYPDTLCGAFYVVGLSHLLRGSAQTAMLWFEIAERAMCRRITALTEGSVLSRANYVAAVFHMGRSAHVLGRRDIADSVIAALRGEGSGRFLDRLASMDDFARYARRIPELS